jgi:hypothetical protein
MHFTAETLRRQRAAEKSNFWEIDRRMQELLRWQSLRAHGLIQNAGTTGTQGHPPEADKLRTQKILLGDQFGCEGTLRLQMLRRGMTVECRNCVLLKDSSEALQ